MSPRLPEQPQQEAWPQSGWPRWLPFSRGRGAPMAYAACYIFAISLEVFRLDCWAHEGFNRVWLRGRPLCLWSSFFRRRCDPRQLGEKYRCALDFLAVNAISQNKVNRALG